MWAAEPEGFDDTALSIAKGRRVGNAPEARSICDAILTPMPGVLTFAINAPRLGGVAVVTDSAVREAMRVAFAEFGLVVVSGGENPRINGACCAGTGGLAGQVPQRLCAG